MESKRVFFVAQVGPVDDYSTLQTPELPKCPAGKSWVHPRVLTPKATWLVPQEIAGPNKVFIKGHQWLIVP